MSILAKNLHLKIKKNKTFRNYITFLNDLKMYNYHILNKLTMYTYLQSFRHRFLANWDTPGDWSEVNPAFR